MGAPLRTVSWESSAMSESLPEQARGLAEAAEREIRAAATAAELSLVKSRYLGRSGTIAALLREIPALAAEERKTAGAAINDAKRIVEDLANTRRDALRDAALSAAPLLPVDVTLPGRLPWQGHLHPVTRAWNEICDIFSSMGYTIHDGPEVETDWHNFEALNIPPGHPAREMADTFYVDDSPGGGAGGASGEGAASGRILLRTHTSPVQVRTMLAHDPPLRMICPGAVYRRDNDATHVPMFHQVEGLVVDERTTMAELKGTLAEFARAFFGPSARVRFRASFFPFTEPSAEVDVSCVFCDAGRRAQQGASPSAGSCTDERKGGGAPGAATRCKVCKDTGWLEILGAGMVDPAVFAAMGRKEYDPSRVQGFAFGMGIDRLAMLRYGIDDLRILFENDVRLLEQF
jgi:phenylalanyl-tRNA synthetase alpha chain